MLITCHPVTGEERDYLMWEAHLRVVCNESSPLDACDEPEYCIPNTLTCNSEPNRCARAPHPAPTPTQRRDARAFPETTTLVARPSRVMAASILQLVTMWRRARRSTMFFQPPCPHLLSATSIYPAAHFMRCWEQADGSTAHSDAVIPGESTGARSQLHYQADPALLTAMVPTLTASCNDRPVQPRFKAIHSTMHLTPHTSFSV